jgi:hypothetical protein
LTGLAIRGQLVAEGEGCARRGVDAGPEGALAAKKLDSQIIISADLAMMHHVQQRRMTSTTCLNACCLTHSRAGPNRDLAYRLCARFPTSRSFPTLQALRLSAVAEALNMRLTRASRSPPQLATLVLHIAFTSIAPRCIVKLRPIICVIHIPKEE